MRANVVLYARENASGEYFIKLRLSEGKKKYFVPIKSGSTLVSIPKTKWDEGKQRLKAVAPKSPGYNDYLSLRNLLNETLTRYSEMIKSLALEGRSVTFDQLIEMVDNPVKKNVTVYDYFNILIDRFKTANNLGQARVHKLTMASIRNFQKPDKRFSDITLSWLKRYEDHLRKNGLKDTTISIYFRTLRAVYNYAIGEGFAKQIDYPFGKKSDNKVFTVSKFDDKTRKRAITKDQIRLIEELQDLTPDQEAAREYFLFSYYCAGINFNDIAKLRWTDYDGARISYKRTKTHADIVTFVLPYAKEMISRLRFLTGIDQENYIFDILNKHIHITPQQIENRIHKKLGQVNKALKEIAKKIEIKDEISTYTARHSFITHAAQSGQITPFDLQKMVGHKDIKTTMIYYQDSSQDKKDELMQKIMCL